MRSRIAYAWAARLDAVSVAAASLIYVAVADLIPGLHRRVDPAGSAMQVVLISAGIAVIWVAEVTLGA